MRAPTSNPITQGKHGQYNAVDYSSRPDSNIYAPEDGTISVFSDPTCGNSMYLYGATGRHGFCHLSKYVVSSGSVKKGQIIGIMGYSGYTEPAGPNGTHLHWVLNINGTYVYPPTKVTEGGTSVASDQTIKQVFNMGLRRDPDPGAYTTYRQTTDQVLVNSVYTSSERVQVEKNLSNVQAQANAVPGLQADASAKQNTINQQTDQINALTAQNADKAAVIEKQNEVIAKLQAGQQVDPDSVVINKDGLWEWFKNFINFFKK